jgi:hypothetical protein
MKPCENETCNPPKAAATIIGGHWFCKECAQGIRDEIKRRSGAGRFNVWQAIKRSN